MLRIETIFETYTVQSASEHNTINLEVPIQALTRALKSAVGATSVQLRLTKKDNVPMLALTIVNNTFTSGNNAVAMPAAAGLVGSDEFGDFDFHTDVEDDGAFGRGSDVPRERETIITQDVPVKVLPMQAVEGLHEPRTQEPDVNIYLPSLQQVKSISERFTRLALATKTGSTSGVTPRLELGANMHGSLKIALRTDALSISSMWTGLVNPELDPAVVEGGSQGIRDHPSTKMKALGEDHWATVRVDAKDFARVLSVGRLGARVIACKCPGSSLRGSLTSVVGFMNETGLVLYVYMQNQDHDDVEESCLTVRIQPFPLGSV